MVGGLLDGDGALVVSIGSVGEMKMRYLSEIPLTIERMSHSVDTRPGPYGFRAWTEDKPPRGVRLVRFATLQRTALLPMRAVQNALPVNFAGL
jgi:hypothetical protein